MGDFEQSLPREFWNPQTRKRAGVLFLSDIVCYNINMTDPTSSARLIAPVVKKLRFSDAKNDVAYWRTRSYQERIEALEQIREEYHRWKADAEPGLQRVYSIVKR